MEGSEALSAIMSGIHAMAASNRSLRCFSGKENVYDWVADYRRHARGVTDSQTRADIVANHFEGMYITELQSCFFVIKHDTAYLVL